MARRGPVMELSGSWGPKLRKAAAAELFHMAFERPKDSMNAFSSRARSRWTHLATKEVTPPGARPCAP